MDEWMEAAACKGHPTAWWFPEHGQSTKRPRAICASCPVRQNCLRYALDNHEQFGLWGGMTLKERRRLR